MANKTTADRLIEEISRRTNQGIDKAQQDLDAVRKSLENSLNKSPLGNAIDGIKKDVARTVKSTTEVVETITKPAKFKQNIWDRWYTQFDKEFPKFLKKQASKFDPIIKPIKSEVGRVVKELTRVVVKPLTKSIDGIVKRIDTSIFKPFYKRLDDALIKPTAKASTAILANNKALTKFLLEEAPLVGKFIKGVAPFLKTLIKILPIVGLIFDALSNQEIIFAIESQQKQISALNQLIQEQRLTNIRQTKSFDSLQRALAAQGVSNGVFISPSDKAFIINSVVNQIRPLFTPSSAQLVALNAITQQIKADTSTIKAQPKVDPQTNVILTQLLNKANNPTPVTARVDLSGVEARLGGIQSVVNIMARDTAAIPGLTLKVDSNSGNLAQVLQSQNQIVAATGNINGINEKVNAIAAVTTGAALTGIVVNAVRSNPPNLAPQFSGLNNSIANVNSNVSATRGDIAGLNTRLNNPIVASDPKVLQKLTQVETSVAKAATDITQVNTKLGTQLPNGGIGGKLTRIGEFLHLGQAMNLINTWLLVHNAMQLSNNVVYTLEAVMSGALQLVGITGTDGTPIDIGSLVNAQLSQIFQGIVGKENALSITAQWKAANKIYQSATNILNQMMSIQAAIFNVMEVIGNNVHKIGNALRRWGVVGERAYEWLNPNMSLDNRYMRFLNGTADAASNLEQVTSSLVDIQTTSAELATAKTQLETEIKTGPLTTETAKTESVAKLAKEAADKTASQGANINLGDLIQ